jgi:hypothetical protein
MLCRKAGVPAADVRGNITSHRARSTIASQLYNAKEPMTLFELQAWLGHRTPQSTTFYAKISPDHVDPRLRRRRLLRPQRPHHRGPHRPRRGRLRRRCRPASRGSTTTSATGYCTYTFFEQCQHRMACAKCDFYTPKDSSKGQLLEAKENLQRMLAPSR